MEFYGNLTSKALSQPCYVPYVDGYEFCRIFFFAIKHFRYANYVRVIFMSSVGMKYERHFFIYFCYVNQSALVTDVSVLQVCRYPREMYSFHPPRATALFGHRLF